MHIIFYNNAREIRNLGSWNIFAFDDYTVLHTSLVGTVLLNQIMTNLLNRLN
jgi:hypothetical protein